MLTLAQQSKCFNTSNVSKTFFSYVSAKWRKNKQLSFIKAILYHRDTNPLGSLRPNDVCQQKENQ